MAPDGREAVRAGTGSGGHRMTMRVYQTAPDGTVTQKRAEVVVVGDSDTPAMGSAFPPCQCPRCHAGGVPG
jgi:hypothetical protein